MTELRRTGCRSPKPLAVRTLLQRCMPELVERYKVKSLGVFGSYARADPSKRSDLDLLVEFSETPDLFQFMELERYLETILGLKVDLVSRGALRGKIGKRILEEVLRL